MPIEHTKHIWRALIVILFIFIGFLILRLFMIPKSWGLYGHYRYEAVKEEISHPVLYGGKESCQQCHNKEMEELESGKHKNLSCESCHAPLRTHVEEGEKVVSPMKVDRSYSLCARCHEALLARPKTMPQIVLSEHLEMMDIAFQTDVCLTCHFPHAPMEGL